MADKRSGLGRGLRDFSSVPDRSGQFSQSQQAQQQTVTIAPPTPWVTPASSRVAAMRYVPDQYQIQVEFVKGGTKWVYENCSAGLYQAFAAAASKGQFINIAVNGGRGGQNDNGYEVGAFQP